MASLPSRPANDISLRELNPATIYALLVAVPTIFGIAFGVASQPEKFNGEVLIWIALVAAAELLPVPAWRGIHVSLGFPLLMAVGILYPPAWAGAIALIGSVDPVEFRGGTTLLKAVFNRSQVALAVLLASATFHALADVSDPITLVIAATLAASLVDYITNLTLVVVATGLMYRTSILALAKRLPRVSEFIVSYAGLSAMGAVLAKLSQTEGVGLWAVLVVIAPLLFARQMFLRSHDLEEAHVELQEREEILRVLSNTMAEERADERLQIAGYLHDDLAQVLFRLSLQVDIARKMLDKQDLEDLKDQLEKIKDSKQDTSDRIRALIRELHRSPLGATGLAESLESFTDEVGRDSGIRFHHDVDDIDDLPAPTALLIFNIAREGVMNAMKHADPSDVWIGVAEADENIVLKLRDNGSGFDTSAPGPEGHFGMAMMRERAKVGGGTLDVASSPDDGTTITVRFPTSLLQRDQDGGTGSASASTQAHASLGTPGTTAPTAEGSRGAVHA
jgi:signal transduction histidine kinase